VHITITFGTACLYLVTKTIVSNLILSENGCLICPDYPHYAVTGTPFIYKDNSKCRARKIYELGSVPQASI
jgi:hypothetical protein